MKSLILLTLSEYIAIIMAREPSAMPKNKVQFQKGLSLTQFLQDYGSEAQCEQALFAARWLPMPQIPHLTTVGWLWHV